MAKYKIGDVLVGTYCLGVVTSIINNLESKYKPDGTYETLEVLLYGLNGYSGNSSQLSSGNGSGPFLIKETDVKGKIEYA